VLENPSPPARSDSLNSVFMFCRSVASASSALARSPITVRRKAEWPTRKAGVHGQRVVEAVKIVAKALPCPPRHAGIETFQRHALDAGQHAFQVLRVSAVADNGAMVKPQLPP